MSKKLQQSLRIMVLAVSAMVVGSPTIAQVTLADIKKSCNEQHPNQAYFDCKKKNNCGNDKSCKNSCNTVPEVQSINKIYDSCVSEKSGQNK